MEGPTVMDSRQIRADIQTEYKLTLGVNAHGEVPDITYGPIWLEMHASNYGAMLEQFDTMESALDEMIDRDLPSNTYYPLWSEGFHAYIYGANPTKVDGAYPLAELYPVWNEDTDETTWTLSEA